MSENPYKIQIDLLLYCDSLEYAKSLGNEIVQSLKDDYIADFEKETIILRECYQFDKEFQKWKDIHRDSQ